VLNTAIQKGCQHTLTLIILVHFAITVGTTILRSDLILWPA
jgi:hypothetical protein